MALYEAGLTLAETGRALGISEATVRLRLNAAGVARRTRWSRPTAIDERHLITAQAREAALLYTAGLTLAEVATQMEMSDSTVRHRLDTAGVARRPRATRRISPEAQRLLEAETREAARLYEAGATLDEVAEVMGCGVRVVRRRLDLA
ncbi:ECF-type sigma factor [Streptomyces hydrogenans]|uniref:ECF-type sigma factor n=1 Tax=Streptomyces hydrogenans TaxID=1873719 RepID=UPI0038299BFC